MYTIRRGQLGREKATEEGREAGNAVEKRTKRPVRASLFDLEHQAGGRYPIGRARGSTGVCTTSFDEGRPRVELGGRAGGAPAQAGRTVQRMERRRWTLGLGEGG